MYAGGDKEKAAKIREALITYANTRSQNERYEPEKIIMGLGRGLGEGIDGNEILSTFNILRGLIQQRAMNNNPPLVAYLQAYRKTREDFVYKDLEEKPVPEPDRASPPRFPNDPWSPTYVKDFMAAHYGPKWGLKNPYDDKPVAYNQLSSEAKKSINNYVSRLNKKTIELFPDEKDWRSLSSARKQRVINALQKGPAVPKLDKSKVPGKKARELLSVIPTGEKELKEAIAKYNPR